MMRKVLLGVVVAILATSVPAGAWEPDFDEWEQFPDPIGRETPSGAESYEVPDGVYFVTDTYVRDVVTTEGPTTRYSTETVHESTGSYARVLDVVGTGASSPFDSSAFNGRAELNDGRAVAGTFYENFVLTPAGFVSVSVVFFQDDSLTSVARIPPEPAAPSASAPTAVPISPTMPGPVAEPPLRERDRDPAPVTATAGVALAPDGPTLVTAEVLRGCQVDLWPRAFVNGHSVPVSAWRLVSATPDHVSATFGTKGPLVAQWLRMPGRSERWTLVFDISTDHASELALTGAITIVVRSPALVD